jgi:catechol 2,3-dioxygenase-like lactoylglutathione lyase family enzyme
MNPTTHAAPFAPDVTAAVVRYQVRDVERSIAFYTERLGFRLVHRAGPIIATVARGDLHLLLSGPKSSGARDTADGRQQEPGGWNRIVLYVKNLESSMAELERSGVHFSNRMEEGPGGKQIQLEDPDGNAIELHEAPK